MNTKSSNRIIAAGGMAAVIALGAAVFFMSSPTVAPVARVEAPAAPVAETPAAGLDTVAQLPGATAAPADIPAAPTAAAPNDAAAKKEAPPSAPVVADAKPVRHRDSAAASSPVDTSSRAAARSGPVVAATEMPAAAKRADAAVDTATAPMTASAPAVDPETGASGKLVASDSQITTEVKSAIASEGLTKDARIDVTTTDGVVALSGSVPSEAAIEQVKDVAAKVKDVKGVDVSGLVASL